jgi:basic membrane lipoprotein Med (substrate-binding protein (PBP1-ABC) superfamily)
MHSDSADSLKEADKVGDMGIGYNSDMHAEAPHAALTSVVWNWDVYYTALVRSVVLGNFTTAPYFGSLRDHFVDLAPLNENMAWDKEIVRMLEAERERIETGEHPIFRGVLDTNDARKIGKAGEAIPDAEIQSGMDWYYRTIIEL